MGWNDPLHESFHGAKHVNSIFSWNWIWGADTCRVVMSYFCPCFTPTSIPNNAQTLLTMVGFCRWFVASCLGVVIPTWKRSGGLVETLRRKSEVGFATSVVVATQTFLYFQPLGDDPIWRAADFSNGLVPNHVTRKDSDGIFDKAVRSLRRWARGLEGKCRAHHNIITYHPCMVY